MCCYDMVITDEGRLVVLWYCHSNREEKETAGAVGFKLSEHKSFGRCFLFQSD